MSSFQDTILWLYKASVAAAKVRYVFLIRSNEGLYGNMSVKLVLLSVLFACRDGYQTRQKYGLVVSNIPALWHKQTGADFQPPFVSIFVSQVCLLLYHFLCR
jgi:hypothetical protein